MFNMNILLSWNQSTNDWIKLLNEFIKNNEYVGLYNLGEKWNEISNYPMIELIMKDDIESLIRSIDIHESMTNKLNKAVELIENNKSIFKGIKIDKLLNQKNKINNIRENVINELNSITDIDVDKFISIYNFTIPHENITTNFYVKILKKNKKTDILELYKRKVLNVDSSKYSDFGINIHNIQKINYLIKPFIKSDSSVEKALDISITYQSVSYNILPLMSKIEALKFGPIQNIYTGLNRQLIDRFKTIKIENNVVNSSYGKINENQYRQLPVYTGSSFKKIEPVNFREGYEWSPLKGVDHKVYRYNEISENIILSNMKLEPKEFTPKNFKPIVPSNVLLENKKKAAEICYSELEKFIEKNNITDINIIRELYLIQFFNVNRITDSMKYGNMEIIEVIPISRFLHSLKLI